MSKAKITITLEDDGRIGFNSTTQNLITLFGMLELAKKIVNESNKTVNQDIVLAKEMPNGSQR